MADYETLDLSKDARPTFRRAPLAAPAESDAALLARLLSNAPAPIAMQEMPRDHKSVLPNTDARGFHAVPDNGLAEDWSAVVANDEVVLDPTGTYVDGGSGHGREMPGTVRTAPVSTDGLGSEASVDALEPDVDLDAVVADESDSPAVEAEQNGEDQQS
jgi:hypothetical protein